MSYTYSNSIKIRGYLKSKKEIKMKEEGMLLESLLKYGFETTCDNIRLVHPERRDSLFAKLPQISTSVELDSMIKYAWVIDPNTGRGELKRRDA